MVEVASHGMTGRESAMSEPEGGLGRTAGRRIRDGRQVARALTEGWAAIRPLRFSGPDRVRPTAEEQGGNSGGRSYTMAPSRFGTSPPTRARHVHRFRCKEGWALAFSWRNAKAGDRS
jgi:hypothetical protein